MQEVGSERLEQLASIIHSTKMDIRAERTHMYVVNKTRVLVLISGHRYKRSIQTPIQF